MILWIVRLLIGVIFNIGLLILLLLCISMIRFLTKTMKRITFQHNSDQTFVVTVIHTLVKLLERVSVMVASFVKNHSALL